MNNKSKGLLLLLGVLIIGLVIHMIWKPMRYLEGLTNVGSTNKYDQMYDNALPMVSSKIESINKQVAATPEMATNMNKSLALELHQVVASKGFANLSMSHHDFSPLASVTKNISAENAALISQIITAIIQFLNDFKAQVLTSNSGYNNSNGTNYSSPSGAPIKFSKTPLVIA